MPRAASPACSSSSPRAARCTPRPSRPSITRISNACAGRSWRAGRSRAEPPRAHLVARSGAPRVGRNGSRGHRECRRHLPAGSSARSPDRRQEAALCHGNRASSCSGRCTAALPRVLRSTPVTRGVEARAGSAGTHARPRGADRAHPRHAGFRAGAESPALWRPGSAGATAGNRVPSAAWPLHGVMSATARHLRPRGKARGPSGMNTRPQASGSRLGAGHAA